MVADNPGTTGGRACFYRHDAFRDLHSLLMFALLIITELTARKARKRAARRRPLFYKLLIYRRLYKTSEIFPFDFCWVDGAAMEYPRSTWRGTTWLDHASLRLFRGFGTSVVFETIVAVLSNACTVSHPTPVVSNGSARCGAVRLSLVPLPWICKNRFPAVS